MSQTAFEIKSNLVLRETAQALQEGRKMARSIENVCTSLRPMAMPSTVEKLDAIEENAMKIARDLLQLYNLIAKDAFAGEPSQ